jgi:hypothetical protein
MAAMVKSVFGSFQAFKVWAYNKAMRAEAARQTQELNQTQQTKTGRTFITVGAALATLASHAAAQTFNAATTKITAEGNAAQANLVTILGVFAGLAFVVGLIMLAAKQRGWGAVLISAVGSLILIPVTKALPGLAK